MKPILAIFMIMALGLILGRINFKGVRFGLSAILIVALFFGHFGVELPSIISALGLVLFLAPTGLMAGPTFVPNLKQNGLKFLLIALAIFVLGGLVISISAIFFNIPIELALGLSTGALTSTAMLGSVNELTDSLLPGVGYGIAYVFGVVGVVLFVQLVPLFMKVDKDEENKKLELGGEVKERHSGDELINIDADGLFAIALAGVLGVLLGSIKIPAGENVTVSLGNGGGSIIMGLVLGHFGSIGKINLRPPKKVLSAIRNVGLALFLMQAGSRAGLGFVEVVGEYGIKLFFIGIFMTLTCVVLAFLLAYKAFKLPLFAALGATTGAMTSAPSLGALLTVTEDDKVASYYAAVQPVATVLLVFLPQVISIIFKM